MAFLGRLRFVYGNAYLQCFVLLIVSFRATVMHHT